MNIIVSHLCKPYFSEMIAVLKQHAYLYTDMSGIFDSQLDAAHCDRCVAREQVYVGTANRLIFGTQFCAAVAWLAETPRTRTRVSAFARARAATS